MADELSNEDSVLGKWLAGLGARWKLPKHVDTTAVPIWSEQPHYKHHSIRLKVRGEGNLSLAVERGKNECVDTMIRDPKMVRKCRSSKR